MITLIEFKAVNGSAHPESEELKTTPLAGLIEECIRKNEDIFGSNIPVSIIFSDDGTLGQIILATKSSEYWQPITCVDVTLAMFKEHPLPQSLKKTVVAFFDSYARLNAARRI